MTATGTVKATVEAALPEEGGVTPRIRREMYARNGSEWVALVVFQVNSITVPADEAEKDPAIRLKVLDIELATAPGDDNWARELAAAWHRRRTADGTLEEGQQTADDAAATARAILTGGGDLGSILNRDLDDVDVSVSVNGKTVTTVTELADGLHLGVMQAADA